MGLLDYMEGAKNKLAGLLGEMPISRMIHQGVQPPTVNGLRDALYAMPKPFNADDQAANEAAMAFWNPAGLLGKIVYHGSPHKFTKFDASKIGTGEGAQAYGHGVYLADSEKVAQGYKSKLESGFGADPDDVMARVLNTFGGDSKKAAQELRTRAGRANIPGGKERLNEWANKVESGYDPRGALYKADLPDEWIPKMLDWDKPLSQQSAEIRAAIEKFVSTKYPKHMAEKVMKADSADALFHPDLMNPVASDFISTGLREAGIPGIRYLDGSSRGKGQGSYNYVVFPGLEDQVKILERNGKGLLDY